MVMSDPTLQEKSLTKLEQAARVLRQAILQGDLRPGQKLKQQELAESLGMSATPVREVLRILEAEGLLVHIPHKGVFVAEVSPEDTEEIAPIRVALESLAVKLSVPRLSEDDIANLERLAQRIEQAWQKMDLANVRRYNYHFHATIYRASGSEILCGLIERLWPRFATDLLWMIPGRAERSIEQHRAILEAIKRRDATGAADLMADHITTAGKSIADFMRQQSASVAADLTSMFEEEAIV
ncbi:MAG TPA: GntR family transcriptional regulator [Anaerolineae bacterium]|nr:GntR family transcriptional regulator [Anaerolineae bacterium]